MVYSVEVTIKFDENFNPGALILNSSDDPLEPNTADCRYDPVEITVTTDSMTIKYLSPDKLFWSGTYSLI